MLNNSQNKESYGADGGAYNRNIVFCGLQVDGPINGRRGGGGGKVTSGSLRYMN